VSKSKPQKDVLNKYSKKMLYQSQLPFNSHWKKHVHADDLPIMEGYQYRIRVWFVSFVVSNIIFFIYWMSPVIKVILD
jgi:hypothetical protein